MCGKYAAIYSKLAWSLVFWLLAVNGRIGQYRRLQPKIDRQTDIMYVGHSCSCTRLQSRRTDCPRKTSCKQNMRCSIFAVGCLTAVTECALALRRGQEWRFVQTKCCRPASRTRTPYRRSCRCLSTRQFRKAPKLRSLTRWHALCSATPTTYNNSTTRKSSLTTSCVVFCARSMRFADWWTDRFIYAFAQDREIVCLLRNKFIKLLQTLLFVLLVIHSTFITYIAFVLVFIQLFWS